MTVRVEPSERWVRARRGGEVVVDSRRPVLVWPEDHPVPSYAFPEADVRTARLPAEAVRPSAEPGFVTVDWAAADHWYEEEEEIFIHPRDPHKRVDAIRSSRHVVVAIGGTVVADTRAPVLVFETGLPVRYYVPREDVRFDLFEPTATSTGCPYKGTAEYWSLRGGPADVAWSYPDPLPAVREIAGRIAFYNEVVDLTVDGERRDRPVTPFSARLTGATG